MPNSVEIKTQIPHVLFLRLKMIAELEERSLQSLVEEAVEDVLAKHGLRAGALEVHGKVVAEQSLVVEYLAKK
jgi:hypothetical protein